MKKQVEELEKEKEPEKKESEKTGEVGDKQKDENKTMKDTEEAIKRCGPDYIGIQRTRESL